MNCTFLTNTSIVRAVKIQSSKRAIIPVKNACDTDNPINIELVVSKIKLLKWHSLFLGAREKQILGNGLNNKKYTIAPAVPTLLCCKLRYLSDYALTKEALIF